MYCIFVNLTRFLCGLKGCVFRRFFDFKADFVNEDALPSSILAKSVLHKDVPLPVVEYHSRINLNYHTGTNPSP